MPTPECTPLSLGATEEGVSISVGVLNKNLVVSNKTKRTGEEGQIKRRSFIEQGPEGSSHVAGSLRTVWSGRTSGWAGRS